MAAPDAQTFWYTLASTSRATTRIAPEPSRAPQLRTEQPDQPKADTSLRGELVKVDTTARMLTIKAKDAKTEMVAYDDSTKVTGAQTGIAGLANQPNTKVTVKFIGIGAARVASEIVIEKDTP